MGAKIAAKLVGPAKDQMTAVSALASGAGAEASMALNASSLVKRTTVPRGCLLGDSRMWMSHITVSPASYLNTASYSHSLPYHLSMMTGGRVELPQSLNFGVGGLRTGELSTQTFTQLSGLGASRQVSPVCLANYPNLTPLQAAVRSDADFAIYLCGTNDRTDAVLGSVTQANDLAAIKALLASGKMVIVCTDLPRGDSAHGGLSGAPLTHHLDTAQFLRALRIPGVYIADTFASMVNSASASAWALDGTTYDGVHWGFTGQYLCSVEIAKIINALYPPIRRLRCSAADVWSATNPRGAVTQNPLLLGSGGTLATNWTATLNGLSATYSYITGAAVAGKALSVTIGNGASIIQILNYDNSYPGSNGAVLSISASYPV